jgi:hypothetical protein
MGNHVFTEKDRSFLDSSSLSEIQKHITSAIHHDRKPRAVLTGLILHCTRLSKIQNLLDDLKKQTQQNFSDLERRQADPAIEFYRLFLLWRRIHARRASDHGLQLQKEKGWDKRTFSLHLIRLSASEREQFLA